LISCNWTDQLLFTYKMALCNSHSHSFVCGWNILIKFMYLTDIYLDINWWNIQQNMPFRFLEILIFLGGCFLCRTLYIWNQYTNVKLNMTRVHWVKAYFAIYLKTWNVFLKPRFECLYMQFENRSLNVYSLYCTRIICAFIRGQAAARWSYQHTASGSECQCNGGRDAEASSVFQYAGISRGTRLRPRPIRGQSCMFIVKVLLIS